jgi:starch phosphorylase
MKPLSTFHIIPDLPAPLTPLWDLSHNLWWTWSQDTIRILYQIDPEKWIASGRNPLRFLASLSQQQLDTLADDPTLQGKIKAITDQFKAYTWYDQHNKNGAIQIAYFSAEFGLAESLPIYSGGLGILASDHLKAASDLGLPLVGMGLLYRQGYFHQALNPDGWQLEMNPESDFDQMPIRPARYPSGDTIVIDVPYPSGTIKAQVWSVVVGRVTLYLLDTNLENNRPEDREITDLLYGGDKEMRMRQEILLGIGGLRALDALDIQPTICHMNEGHSAFQALERIRTLMDEQGLSFGAAREASAAGNIFTTHTPVPAGNDWFPPDLVESYLGTYRATLGLSREEFLGLGRIDPDDRKSDFCMTVLALRLSADSNGVSRLHGEVSRQMWAGYLAESDVPITSITNGIHSPTWVALEMADLFDRYLGEDWRYRPEVAGVWDNIRAMPDNELWATHQYRRQHLENQFKRHGLPPSKIDQTLSSLGPDALTIGFARRGATYKRGNLVFRTIERLAALFADQQRPLQIFFAGKAHPHDHPGKELILEITHIARQEPFAGKVFFIEDYDMNVARYLVQGCDVWLNKPAPAPRRPAAPAA